MRVLKPIALILAFAAVAAAGFYFGFRTGSSHPADSEAEWKDQYAAVLRTYLPDSSSAKFNLHDLDGDGTPELLISDGDFHMAGAEIFTLYRGAVYCLGSFGSWGDFQYAPETGHIYSGYTGQGCTHSAIFQIVDGKLKDIVSFFDTTGYYMNPEDGSFEVNGASVSAEDYNREWEKYAHKTDDNFTARKYALSEEEIARVLAPPY